MRLRVGVDMAVGLVEPAWSESLVTSGDNLCCE